MIVMRSSLIEVKGAVKHQRLAEWSKRPELLFLDGKIPYDARVEVIHRPVAQVPEAGVPRGPVAPEPTAAAVAGHPVDDVGQALGARHEVLGQQPVPLVAGDVPLRAGLDRRRRRVVRAAPQHELLVAVLLLGLGLVQALQRAVVALVEAPGMHHRQPGAVHLVEHVPQRARGALEDAGVAEVEVVAFGLEQPPGQHRLLQAQRRQVDVGPAGEAVFEVPGRFAVADQDEFVHVRSACASEGETRHFRIVGWPVGPKQGKT